MNKIKRIKRIIKSKISHFIFFYKLNKAKKEKAKNEIIITFSEKKIDQNYIINKLINK